ncbi:MAG: PIN domain-containing protein [Mobilitalea sp.]
MNYNAKVINFFFDTNILKKVNGNLIKFELNETFHSLKRFLVGNEIDFIKIFIPEIVIEELITQYIEDYRKVQESILVQYDSLSAEASKINWDIEINKKTDLDYQSYKEHIRNSSENFIHENEHFVNIVNHCSNDKFIKIIDRAIRKKKPFFRGKYQQKDFTDAGFKDVIFLESVIECLEKNDGDFIIFSKDSFLRDIDLTREIPDRIGRFETLDLGWQIVELIKRDYKIEDYSEIIMFSKTDYFKEMIEGSLVCKIVDGSVEIESEVIEDVLVIKIRCQIIRDGVDKSIVVCLSETKDFIEVLDDESEEVVYEW